MQMQHALQSPGVVDDGKRRDLLLLHNVEGGDGEDVRANDFRRARHAIAGFQVEYLFAVAFEQTAQVAVADEANQLVPFHYCRHAQFLARHLVDDLSHGRVGLDTGNRVATVHQR